MSDFERGPEQPPEITVLDTTGFNKSFPLDVFVDRQGCGAFMTECGVEPAAIGSVGLAVSSKVSIAGQMVGLNAAVEQLQFVECDAFERDVTLYAGSALQAIADASAQRYQLPLSTVQRHINRELGMALSCCVDDMTIGFEAVQKEIQEAKAAMRRAALARRLPIAVGGNALSLAISQGATGSLLAGSVAVGILSGVSFFECRDFLRKQYQVTTITEGWPYHVRAKKRVADLIEAPNASPLVTFDWKPDR